jgi:hypothetical protein
MPFNHADITEIFTYHPPTPDQQVAYEKLRSAAKDFANAIIDLTPASPDQSSALRYLRVAVHIANAAIALKGKY